MKSIKTCIFFMAGFFLIPLFSSYSEEIELPDVTTVINGKTLKAGKDSVPDFTEVQVEAPSVKITESPKEPEMPPPPDEEIAKNEKPTEQKKDIFANGEVGAGYPFYFKGDFSVFRDSGNSPFEINFSHESAEGFALKKANEGYFQRDTNILGKKSFIGTNGKHDFEAGYKTSDDGLQFNSSSYSDMIKHTISGKAKSEWKFENGIIFSYGADGAWFNRYSQIIKTSVTTNDFLDSTKILDVNPNIGFGWQGENFKAMVLGFYNYQGNLEEKENLLKIEGNTNREHSHRGEGKLDLSWKNDSIMIGADGSVIFGTAIGKKDVVPAFTAKFDFKTDSFSSERFFEISARGGLESYQEKIRNLENKYKFAVAPAIPTETTNWFSNLNLSIPILSYFDLKSKVEFKKTAFENGTWAPLYKDSEIFSVIVPEEQTQFNSDLALCADFSSFAAEVGWKTFWKDVPVLEEKHKIKALLEYKKSDSKINAGTSTAISFGKDADKCPEISGWAGFKVSQALTLAFEVNDVIKLVRGTSRSYAHSKYITKSGNAALFARFRF